MKIHVTSTNHNAPQQILMGFNRRNLVEADLTEEICIEVAKELHLEFDRKEENNLYFKELLCIH